MYHIGLIGYGAFGQALTEWLAPYASFTIYDKDGTHDSAKAALAQPIVILAIPAQYLEEFLVTNESDLQPNTLYIDVCSVKVEPVAIMKRCLPPSASCIATHPAFGPESAKNGLKGQKIMIYPVHASTETMQEFRSFLGTLELTVIETTPEQHDKDMAYIQGLSHYIGRTMQALNIPDLTLSTNAYRDLLDMKNIQGNDSDALFSSILHSNPYTKQVLEDFKKASKHVDETFGL